MQARHRQIKSRKPSSFAGRIGLKSCVRLPVEPGKPVLRDEDLEALRCLHSNLAHPIPIARYGFIRCQQQQAFDTRLRDENTVERVFVQRRQIVDGDGVFTGDGQFTIAVDQQHAPQAARVNIEVRAFKAVFDGDFPQTRGTEDELIA